MGLHQWLVKDKRLYNTHREPFVILYIGIRYSAVCYNIYDEQDPKKKKLTLYIKKNYIGEYQFISLCDLSLLIRQTCTRMALILYV